MSKDNTPHVSKYPRPLEQALGLALAVGGICLRVVLFIVYQCIKYYILPSLELRFALLDKGAHPFRAYPP